MYFPYLRGRQFELIALRELLDSNKIGNKIIPVIEPIKPTSTLAKTLSDYTQKKHLHAVVMNPEVGTFSVTMKEKSAENDSVAAEIYEDAKSEYFIKAYIMKPRVVKTLNQRDDKDQLMIVNPSRDCLDDYLRIYDEIEPKYTLLPDDRTFSRKASHSKIMFEDKFTKAEKNADYSKKVDEFFSEDHLYYNTEGFKGFSDFSVVGSEYNESGFAPSAVAIHIVYFDKDKVLRIHHFVSDSNVGKRDSAGKFGEALVKLINWIEENNVPRTLGLQGFVDCYEEGKYPGLGTVKKYSIMHHLELMNMFLEGEL
jgi:hypothetical protein